MAININIKIDKKHVYVLTALFVLLIGISLVQGFGGSSPAVVGHTAGEITGLTEGCPAGQSIRNFSSNGSVTCEVDDNTDYCSSGTCAGSVALGSNNILYVGNSANTERIWHDGDGTGEVMIQGFAGVDVHSTSTNLIQLRNNVDVTGEVDISGISGDGAGSAVCIKSNGELGTCSSGVGAGGTCTCA
jgi:hypothetical protein